ncbi:MAG TPA: pitrilysin family protein [Candidatus Limnocylindrales bacterium]|nr:pitrilysin family protein [Candidatus Limnocylindrales bacterium]
MMATPAQDSAYGTIPPLGPERPVVWPRRVRHKLSNGLEIVLVESHTIPKFTAEIYFRSGNAVAPIPGLADMTATVARTGTTRRTSRQIEEDLRRWGADLSTGSGADTSAISFSGLSEFSKPLIELAAEIAREAAFPDEQVVRERRQKVEELRIARTTPGFLAAERLRKTLFGAHPYANFAPTEKQVEGYSREALMAYYRDYYGPEGALFVAVGEFSPEKLIAEIESALGDWTGTPPAISAQPAPHAAKARSVYLVHVPGAVQAEILVGNLAITRKDPNWLKLGLANNIYGGAFNSRLVMNIREQKGYTYSPRSGMNPLRQYGFFTVSAAVRNDVVAASLTEIFYELDRMRSLPVGDGELADAIQYMTGVFSLGLGTQDGIAGQLGTVLLNELPDDYLETYRERVRKLTSADVLEAARKYFDSPHAQIVIAGDREAIGGQAELFGDVEVFDAQGNRL